ncbi:MAG: DUF4230 domain-containing protein [Lachnospiraceae bacterium]|nr:DUF4230 domain-containing protein [Lachnospiraceae bacterium]
MSEEQENSTNRNTVGQTEEQNDQKNSYEIENQTTENIRNEGVSATQRRGDRLKKITRIFGGKYRKIKLASSIVVIGLIVLLFGLRYLSVMQIRKAVSIVSEIKEISKLATYEYDYTLLNKTTSRGSILKSEEITMYMYSGTIIFGIDCEKVDVSVEEEKIIVTLPEVEILSHEIYPDSYIYNIGSNNNTTVLEASSNQTDDKSIAEEQAFDKGCDEQALENARKQIEKMILLIMEDANGETYEIEFAEAE